MTSVLNSPMPLTLQPGQLDDEPLFEIIDGQRVELPPMSILANEVATLLFTQLLYFLQGKSLGRPLFEALLRLPHPVNRSRRPDVAFASTQRLAQAPRQPGSANAREVVPELMVEVISPHDLAEEIMERLAEYWAAGAQLVWVIYPSQRLIYVHEAPRTVRILGDGDELDGGTVLPGFRVPVAGLFPP